MAKNNFRFCIITKKTFPKEALNRFFIVNQVVYYDNDKKTKNRGYYVSKEITDLKIIENVFKKRYKAILDQKLKKI